MRGLYTAALLSYVLMLLLAFGLRALLLRRRIGTTGFRGISGPAGSLPWWAGIAFIGAVILGVAAPAAALAGLLTPPQPLRHPAIWVTGALLAALGSLAILAAQHGMGASWRVGVDENEHTELVTGGPFAVVRNPVFTAMAITATGWALMVPTWLSLAALVALVTAIQMQVRIVEEP